MTPAIRAFTYAIGLFLIATISTRQAIGKTESAVSISEDDASYTLSNGTITARIGKHNGNLLSLQYNGVEMLDSAGRAAGYWSHSAAGSNVNHVITIDPKTNAGRRGEVSVKGISGGALMGSGPGGSTVADIEIRYTLDRGASGLYTYSIFEHKPDYPATSIGEARFCAKLRDEVFDWMTVDANRNMKMITAYDWDHATPMNMKEARRMNSGTYKGQVEHKYDYSANQFDVLAWGWSSTEKHVGIWFINPTTEYLSGGPTKFELSAHRDATFTDSLTAPASPCLLNYWRGSHYGGSRCEIGTGEAWSKVIGPFLIYCNAGPSPEAMWKDALAESRKQSAAWPFGWASAVDYPHRNERGTVSGRLILKDPRDPNAGMTKLLVGLTHPDYVTQGNGRGEGRPVDWQQDAKYYEFWVRGNADGRFTILNVRPGMYTLHAIADGVLGEFTKMNIQVAPGGVLQLGKLDWQPVRHGRQLWDIGIPNRTGAEFFKGDDYFHWGWYLEYPKLFPNDVNFIVGKSNFRKDWFFEQVPHNENPDNVTGQGDGRSTPWTVKFDLPKAPTGTATLRLAICGVGAKSLQITVNDKPAGEITGLNYNATINRDGIGGYWIEKDVSFDASRMNSGSNVLTLTIPAGGLMNGIIYDYLRLELDESPATPSANEKSTGGT